jgi:hypothetical protein
VDPDSEHCLQVLPERVGVASIHIDLGEHVEGHVVFPRKGLESEKDYNKRKDYVRQLQNEKNASKD